MSEPNIDSQIDDEDLEDGEIETDEENDTGDDSKQTKQISSGNSDAAKEPPLKKSKPVDDEKIAKIEQKPKNEKNNANNSKKTSANDVQGKL